MSDKKKTIFWGIWEFPEKLKNKVAGRAKERGLTVGEFVEFIFRKFFREDSQEEDDD